MTRLPTGAFRQKIKSWGRLTRCLSKTSLFRTFLVSLSASGPQQGGLDPRGSAFLLIAVLFVFTGASAQRKALPSSSGFSRKRRRRGTGCARSCRSSMRASNSPKWFETRTV